MILGSEYYDSRSHPEISSETSLKLDRRAGLKTLILTEEAFQGKVNRIYK
jgi:hypothetical protein